MSRQLSPQQIAEMDVAALIILPKSVTVTVFLAYAFVAMVLINVGLVIALATRVATPVAVSDSGVAIQLTPLDKIGPTRTAPGNQ